LFILDFIGVFSEHRIKMSEVLFTNTVDAINSLIVAQKSGRLKLELRKYLKPELLILD
jgi:DNA replication protein DnaC